MNTNQILPAPAHAAPTLPPSDAATPLPYHRSALASPRHRWWRPLITVVVAFGTWAFLSILFETLVGRVAGGSAWVAGNIEEVLGVPSLNRPLGAALRLGQIALMLPAIALGLWVGERRWIGRLSSVAGRLRLGTLGRSFGVAAVAVGVPLLASAAVGVATGALPAPHVTPWTFGMLAVTLLVVPVQAAAEEYAFRGVPQQVLGSWLKSPWWGIVLPIPLFAFAHLYNTLGLLSTALVALAAGVLTWRTGGLEAAIALHVVNNVVAFTIGSFAMSDLTATEVSLTSTLVSAAAVAAFSVAVLTLHGRRAPRS